jgi:tetratricopeptide (TPR) repeat protein
VERAPDGAFVRQLLGKIQLKEERYDEALVTLKLALDLSDNQPSYFKDIALAHVGVGRQALARGDVTAAMEAFSRAKEIDGGEYEVKLALAEGYLARAERFNKWGNVSDAVQDYRFAADILTDLPGTSELREQAAYDVYRIGRRLEEKRIAAGEEIDGEVTAFQIAYDLNEESKTYRSKLAETRVALGDQYAAAGELEQAAYSYSKAHKLYEYNDDYKDKMIAAFEAWGDERLANYDYDDAIEAFLQAYTADPKNDAVKSKLAYTYNERGLDHQFWERYKQAADDFEEAYHLFPDNTEYKTNYYAMASYDDD